STAHPRTLSIAFRARTLGRQTLSIALRARTAGQTNAIDSASGPGRLGADAPRCERYRALSQAGFRALARRRDPRRAAGRALRRAPVARRAAPRRRPRRRPR